MGHTFKKMARQLHQCLGRYLEEPHGHRRRGCHQPLDQMTADSGSGCPVRGEKSVDTKSFSALMESLGYADPVEPMLMLKIFLGTTSHLTASEFSRLLKARGQDISQDKASGVLELFAALGLAEKSQNEDGQDIYEYSHPGLHHDHIVCSGCGQSVEFHRPDVEGLIEKIACDQNYRHLQHKLTIYGLCPSCRSLRREAFPLAETKVGEVVLVVEVNGPEELRQRLGDMGVHRGSTLRILGLQSGSVVVMIDCCRLAMGPELAAEVMVKPAGGRCCGSRRGQRHHGEKGGE